MGICIVYHILYNYCRTPIYRGFFLDENKRIDIQRLYKDL